MDPYAAFLVEYAADTGIDLTLYPLIAKYHRVRELVTADAGDSVGHPLEGAESVSRQMVRARSFSERIQPINSQELLQKQATQWEGNFRDLGNMQGREGNQLFQEMLNLEHEIFQRMSPHTEAARLREISKHVETLEKYFFLRLTPEEFEVYSRNAESYRTHRWVDFINQEILKYYHPREVLKYRSILDDERTRVASFYKTVKERDFSFLERAFNKMEETGREVAVLIAGGYHTPHLTSLLKSQDVSYVIVTPHVLEATDMDNYERILLGNSSQSR